MTITIHWYLLLWLAAEASYSACEVKVHLGIYDASLDFITAIRHGIYRNMSWYAIIYVP